MNEAVIVSTARTPIGKAYRGSLNMTHGTDLAAHCIGVALAKAKIDPTIVEDVVIGCGFREGATGGNVARHAFLIAGLSVKSAAVTVSRFCASGLQTIADAAHRIMCDNVSVIVASGVESISRVQPFVRRDLVVNTWLKSHFPQIYMSMIDTVDLVAKRYPISRQAQDEFSLESQKRTAHAQEAELFNDEIVPITTVYLLTNKETGETTQKTVTLEKDESNRPTTSLEALSKLKSVNDERFVTAGNASQLSDGASASVLMSAKEAAKQNLQPLGVFRGFTAIDCAPEERGLVRFLPFPAFLNDMG